MILEKVSSIGNSSKLYYWFFQLVANMIPMFLLGKMLGNYHFHPSIHFPGSRVPRKNPQMETPHPFDGAQKQVGNLKPHHYPKKNSWATSQKYTPKQVESM